jgi:hypothetical protein
MIRASSGRLARALSWSRMSARTGVYPPVAVEGHPPRDLDFVRRRRGAPPWEEKFSHVERRGLRLIPGKAHAVPGRVSRPQLRHAGAVPEEVSRG